MTLAARIKRIFHRAWRRYGQPTMAALSQPADWLPAGFAWEPSWDAPMNSGGIVLTNASDYYAGYLDTIYIIPAQQTADVRAMVAAGLIPTGTVDVYILAADLATVETAFAVRLDGDWYDVIDPGHAPAGLSGDAGLWSRVRLRRRA